MVVSVALVMVSDTLPATPEQVAVITTTPAEIADTRPRVPAALETVARGLPLLQVQLAVMSCVSPSLHTPVALKVMRVCLAMRGCGGEICTSVSVAAVTTTGVEPVMAPNAALTVAEPWLSALAWPASPAAFDTPSTLGAELLQVTCVERFWAEPSLYRPVATKRWLAPSGIEGEVGVTSMVVKVAGETVTMLEAL